MDDAHWHEDDTRYALIDPILRALDWDTGDPMECHIEYPRGSGWVDYALFDRKGPIGDSVGRAPIIIIEAKALDAKDGLDEGEGQLSKYARAAPRMNRGLGVLTNGRVWKIYNLGWRGKFPTKLIKPVLDIVSDDLSYCAERLYDKLGKHNWWK